MRAGSRALSVPQLAGSAGVRQRCPFGAHSPGWRVKHHWARAFARIGYNGVPRKSRTLFFDIAKNGANI
jgi:hypothetical protein